MYSGVRGPGTFDTTRLIGGRCFAAYPLREYVRMNQLNGFGGAYSSQFAIVSAPRIFCATLASFVTSWIARTRATGSATSVARVVNMFETLLPPSLATSSGLSVE